MSTVWAVPLSSLLHRRHILEFLRDARCSTRAVEVRLFGKDALYKRTPITSRQWQPSADLANTAKEIVKYIAENGPVEATIVAAEEV
jgi:hypothetical protein